MKRGPDVALALKQIMDILRNQLCTPLAVASGGVQIPQPDLRNAAATVAQGLSTLGRDCDDTTMDDVAAVVDLLNDEQLEAFGEAWWTMTYATRFVAVAWNGIPMWDSESDNRDDSGICDDCDGSGTAGPPTSSVPCTACGGSGTGCPKEPLILYLRRRILSMADRLRDLGQE